MMEPPAGGRVYEKTGSLMASARAYGRLQGARDFIHILKRRGRPPDAGVSALVARIDSAEYSGLGSLWAKCRQVAYEDLCVPGVNPDEIATSDVERRAKKYNAAYTRFYKKRI